MLIALTVEGVGFIYVSIYVSNHYAIKSKRWCLKKVAKFIVWENAYMFISVTPALRQEKKNTNSSQSCRHSNSFLWSSKSKLYWFYICSNSNLCSYIAQGFINGISCQICMHLWILKYSMCPMWCICNFYDVYGKRYILHYMYLWLVRCLCASIVDTLLRKIWLWLSM